MIPSLPISHPLLVPLICLTSLLFAPITVVVNDYALAASNHLKGQCIIPQTATHAQISVLRAVIIGYSCDW